MRIMDWVMRIVAYVAFVSLIFTSCSTINIINSRLTKLIYVDSAIKPYVQRFIEDARKRKVSIPEMSRTTVVFGTTRTKDEPITVGFCDDVQGWPFITVSEADWAYSDDYEKEQLVFHELGHCVLGRDHCDVTRNDQPVSIMEVDLGRSAQAYKTRREEFVNELFNPDSECPESKNKNRAVPHKNKEEPDAV